MRQRPFRRPLSSSGRRTYTLLAMLAGFLFSSLAHAEFVVILNPAVPIEKLTREEVARIFMKKSKTLPTGEEIIPLSQSSRADVNERFFATITGQDRIQRDAYWARLLFTGKGRPPEDAKTDQNVKQRVAQDRRYIGYINSNQVDKSVKVVYRVP